MKARRQWVVWGYEERDGKETKPPRNPHTGRYARSDDRATWGTFEEAVAAVPLYKLTGVGYVFTADDPYFGLDLDKCRDPLTGAIAPWAQRIISAMATHTEVSPSQTGVKLVGRGTPATTRHKVLMGGGAVELYSELRYFTMTGRQAPDTPNAIEERQEQLNHLCRGLFSEPSDGKGRAGTHTRGEGHSADDQAIIDRAMRAGNGDKFRRLWQGDTSDYGGDDSAADLALCSLLGFWTQGDAGRVDGLYRQSGLFRDKWDSKRPGGTYGSITIEKALAGKFEYYDPRAGWSVYVGDAPPPNGHQEPSAEPSPAAKPEPTDLGNARRFVEQHRGEVRYCYAWRKWLVWTGQRWIIDDAGEVERKAKRTVRSMLVEASLEPDDAAAKVLARWAMQSQSAKHIGAMISLSQSEPGIPISPNDLDTDPYLFNVANGTIDLHTGVRRDARREDLMTKMSPVAYDPAATCPAWDAFVEQIMGGKAALITFLQKQIGYALTGDRREQCLFVFYGGGSNGKSTYLDALRACLGDYALHTGVDTFMTKRGEGIPNDIARLFGARFVTAVESAEGKRLNESLVKTIAGGDPLVARFLHAEFFEFVPSFLVVIATNHLPRIDGADHGLWRKLRTVPFTVTIPDDEQDKGLPGKLRHELPGILRWAMDGCLAWQREGLAPPQAVADATASYRADSDLLGAWLAECCIVRSSVEETAKALFDSYKLWCEAGGETPDSQRTLGRKLAERGFTQRKSGSRRLWVGLRLRTDQDKETAASDEAPNDTREGRGTHCDADLGVFSQVKDYTRKYGNQRPNVSHVPNEDDAPPMEDFEL